jgi:hypothetical protein
MTLSEAQQIVGRRLYGANWIGRLPPRISWLLGRSAANKPLILAHPDEEIAAAKEVLLQLASQYQHVQDWLVTHKFSWDLGGPTAPAAPPWDNIDPIALEHALACNPDMLPTGACDDISDHDSSPVLAMPPHPSRRREQPLLNRSRRSHAARGVAFARSRASSRRGHKWSKVARRP